MMNSSSDPPPATHQSHISEFLPINTRYFQSVFNLVTHANGSRAGRVFSGVLVSVCLFVGRFFHKISQNPTQPGSPNLTQKWSTMSPGQNRLFLGQGHDAQKHCLRGSCECWRLLDTKCIDYFTFTDMTLVQTDLTNVQ